ncbi:hypothetical protein AVEN_56581-1 [Araneus ventricosus]|uniref:Uncharacterized protein n=1 Tax=Araneus ventricosus TaxID=182803 RepID=A0A4Y2U036_ARAVE|nr:hypothetical protein AVEN_226497-1 [Araneus ventricosus]GBO05336.1 hypothetical protein AVEN_56581-1 [Araneus ventricosus]
MITLNRRWSYSYIAGKISKVYRELQANMGNREELRERRDPYSFGHIGRASVLGASAPLTFYPKETKDFKGFQRDNAYRLETICKLQQLYAAECIYTVSWHMRKPAPNFEQEWLKRVVNNLVSRQKIRGIIKFISENRDLFRPP